MVRRYILWPILIIGLFSIHCSKSDEDDADILARVGSRVITVQEFVMRCEFSPLPDDIRQDEVEGKRRALDLLIAEKLFAQEAERQGLLEEPILQKKLHTLEMAAVGRELYREEVQKKVVVEESEIQEAYAKMGEKRVVRFLRTTRLEEAETWQKEMEQGISFNTLWDKAVAVSGDTSTNSIEITWGEYDENLEDAAYTLAPGEVSPLVKASDGYYLLTLENRTRDIMQTHLAFASKRRSIEKILRHRKEAARSDAFVSSFMKDKQVTLKGGPFAILMEALEQRIDFDSDDECGFKPKIQHLEESEVVALENELESHLDDVLVEFSGGGWTIREFLEKLWLQEVPIQRQSRRHFIQGMREAFGIMARDALLAEEGIRKGLRNRSSVQRETKMWQDYLLYVSYKNTLRSEGQDISMTLEHLYRDIPVDIQDAKMHDIAITDIPLLAIWTDFQRQLVVPMWPRFEILPE